MRSLEVRLQQNKKMGHRSGVSERYWSLSSSRGLVGARISEEIIAI